jgi:putative metalloprotease
MKKLAIFGAMIVMMMTSCTSLKLADQDAAINAGTAAVQALTISDSQIAHLCSEYMAETDGQNTILPADNEYTQRLNRIMGKFHNIDGLNLNYKVYQSSTVNAFASGDGSVRVYSGLMDVMDDDELFAVIGHELGHLKNKDVRDAYRTSYLIVAARYGIAAYNQTAGAIATGFLGDLGQELASNAYSRKQEYEADEASFQFCITNNVDPYAMYRALNVLIGLNSNSSTQGIVAQMFATHPDSSKRAARIKEMAEAAGYKMTTPGSTNTNSGNNSGNSNGGGKKKVTVKKG